MSDARPQQEIIRLIGVYDADGTIRGELAYWIGARLGRSHCSLCEVTHGSVRERPEWKTYRTLLGVRFDTYHRDDQPAAIKLATGDAVPVVVVETAGGVVPLLDPTELEACAGSIERLAGAIESAVVRLGLAWPAT